MSNLLDKASIILTPTAYSEGVVHTVKPEIELGEELIDLNNFSVGASWTDNGDGSFYGTPSDYLFPK